VDFYPHVPTFRIWHSEYKQKKLKDYDFLKGRGEREREREREREMLHYTGSNLSSIFVVTSYLMLTHQSPEPSERRKDRKKSY